MPLYQELTEKQWCEKIDFLRFCFSPCMLCPRRCGTLREEGKSGFCGALDGVKVASHNLHHGEEPPVSGERGSGTVFFSGCTMKCPFCQNFPISHLFNGTFYTINELAEIMLRLQKRGAHNINLVTGTPYLYHFVSALKEARAGGLRIPIVYNTSGYERLEVIEALAGIVDIYMPDLKYFDESLGKKYAGVTDYFSNAYPSIIEMFSQVGKLKFDDEGMVAGGMILRHLILPGHVENSKGVLDIIAKSSFKETHLSLMSQYFPAYNATKMEGINRRILPEEYIDVKEHALSLGFSDGWFQDL